MFSAALRQLLIGLDGVYSSLHLLKPRPRVGASLLIDPFSISVTSDLTWPELPSPVCLISFHVATSASGDIFLFFFSGS